MRDARRYEFVALAEALFGSQRLGQVGLYPTGQYAVDLDVVFRPRRRKAFGELHNAALARRIRHNKIVSEYGCHRADVDYLAAARPRHMRIDGAARQECPRQVDVHNQVPIVQRVVLRRFANADAGVVHQDVYAAESVQRGAYHIGYLLFALHVGRGSNRLRAQRLDALHGVGGLALIARRHHDIRARLRQSYGDAKPDAAVAAGYDCRLAAQIKHCVAHCVTPESSNSALGRLRAYPNSRALSSLPTYPLWLPDASERTPLQPCNRREFCRQTTLRAACADAKCRACCNRALPL